MILVKSKDLDLWDKFQHQSEQNNIFMSSNFINSLGLKHDKIFFKDGENILASAVIFTDLKKNSIPFSMYQGISFANFNLNEQKKITKEFRVTELFLNKLTEKYKKIFFSLHPSFSDLRPFQWLNYHEPQKKRFNINLKYSAVINLKKHLNFENYLESIRGVRRRVINRAKSDKFKIVDSNDTKVFLNLYKKTFERQNINPYNLELVENIINFAIKEKYGRLTICYDNNNKPNSSIFILHNNKTAYYMFGAADPEFRKNDTSSILIGESVKKSYELGLNEFDMCGVNSPNRGDFKLSFNAELKPFYEVSYGKFN